MARIGFTVSSDDFQPDPIDDHAVYNQADRTAIQHEAGKLTYGAIGKLVDLEYKDGTGERVKIEKITHYRNRAGSQIRGASNYEDGEALTQLIISRNGDTRSLVMRSVEPVKVWYK